MAKKLRIVHIASEVAPYSKTGGLADVAKALPKAQTHLGHKVTVITPFYGFIKKQNLDLNKVDFSTSISVGDKKFVTTFKKLDFSDSLKIYFVTCEKLFGNRSKVYGYPDDNLRYFVFNVAALRFLEANSPRPNIIHCHDWQAGLVPNILKRESDKFPLLKKAATVFTIHNLSFQSGTDLWGISPKLKDDGKGSPLRKLGKLKYFNFTKRAIFHADAINAVSERYAEEITTREFGHGLEKYLRNRKKDLYGIINGIDYTVNNPAFDNNITYKYDWNSLGRKKKNKIVLQKIVGLEKNPDIPLISIVNRLTEQKGFNLIMETMDILMRLDLQMVIVGSGYRKYVTFFKKVARQYPKKLAFYSPFTEEMESRVYAGSDMFLMPSRFEPCGISQLKSLRYGSIPIVHETGGLSDTITDFNPKTRKGNGFVFKKFTREDFLIALARALENYRYPQVWEFLTWNGMRQTYSWELPAKKYINLYNIAIKNRKAKK